MTQPPGDRGRPNPDAFEPEHDIPAHDVTAEELRDAEPVEFSVGFTERTLQRARSRGDARAQRPPLLRLVASWWFLAILIVGTATPVGWHLANPDPAPPPNRIPEMKEALARPFDATRSRKSRELAYLYIWNHMKVGIRELEVTMKARPELAPSITKAIRELRDLAADPSKCQATNLELGRYREAVATIQDLTAERALVEKAVRDFRRYAEAGFEALYRGRNLNAKFNRLYRNTLTYARRDLNDFDK